MCDKNLEKLELSVHKLLTVFQTIMQCNKNKCRSTNGLIYHALVNIFKCKFFKFKAKKGR